MSTKSITLYQQRVGLGGCRVAGGIIVEGDEDFTVGERSDLVDRGQLPDGEGGSERGDRDGVSSGVTGGGGDGEGVDCTVEFFL